MTTASERIRAARERSTALLPCDTRVVVEEPVFEKMLDLAVMRHLYRDPRYRNAANAWEQSQAEETIEAEQLARLEQLYRVA